MQSLRELRRQLWHGFDSAGCIVEQKLFAGSGEFEFFRQHTGDIDNFYCIGVRCVGEEGGPEGMEDASMRVVSNLQPRVY